MKYTREDVITWEDDERLKDAIGKSCYMADSPIKVLNRANSDFDCVLLDGIRKGESFPFYFNGSCRAFIILKKESEKKLVPFDFSLKEDRDALIGKKIQWTYGSAYTEGIVDGFTYGFRTDKTWYLHVADLKITARALLEQSWLFADTGKPVGKEV